MPSDKRARQRALRDQKMAIVERGQRRRKRARRVGGAILVAGAIVGLIVLLSGNNSPPKKAAATTTTTNTTTTTASSSTTTSTVAAIAPVCPPTAGSRTRVINFTKAPANCVATNGVYDATVVTDVGTFVIRMDAASSYAAVNNFVFLARYHFYDGIIFHRVIPGFVVQGGDPTGTGDGGPGYTYTGNTPAASCEKPANNCYPTGSVAMANSTGPSSNGSQFFVVLPGGDTQLSANYSLLGTVTSGLSVVEKIGADGTSSGTPKVTHHMVKVTITQVST